MSWPVSMTRRGVPVPFPLRADQPYLSPVCYFWHVGLDLQDESWAESTGGEEAIPNTFLQSYQKNLFLDLHFEKPDLTLGIGKTCRQIAFSVIRHDLCQNESGLSLCHQVDTYYTQVN